MLHEIRDALAPLGAGAGEGDAAALVHALHRLRRAFESPVVSGIEAVLA